MQPIRCGHEKGQTDWSETDDRDKSKSLQEQECLIQQIVSERRTGCSIFGTYPSGKAPLLQGTQLGVIENSLKNGMWNC